MSTCPDCKNNFAQPFLCVTCGAEKLYDATLKAAQSELAALRDRFAVMEEARDAEMLKVANRDADLAALRQMLLEAEEGIILRDAAAIQLRLQVEEAERKLAEAERRGMERAASICNDVLERLRPTQTPRDIIIQLESLTNAIRAAADTKERPDG